MKSKKSLIKENYGWMLVVILAILPMFLIFNMITIEFDKGISVSLVQGFGKEGKSTLEMMYHISGEFAIRWMTAVLTCTPFFILFGIHNLFVRQAMGIATAIWSLLHFIIFMWAQGFPETFTQVNYVAGFIAVLILIPLFLTSNRKAMKWLKAKWKKLQSLAYAAIIISLLHVAILEKTWIIYAIIVGLGFMIRVPFVKERLIAFLKHRYGLQRKTLWS